MRYLLRSIGTALTWLWWLGTPRPLNPIRIEGFIPATPMAPVLPEPSCDHIFVNGIGEMTVRPPSR